MGASVEDSYAALDAARQHFANATDFTIGIEEEFQILNRDTLAMTNRFEELRDACEAGPLHGNVAGELIASEIEVKTGRGETFDEAAHMIIDRRVQLAIEAEKLGVLIGATGTHPTSPWSDQRIIDTPHYQRVEDELGYIAWINNTWSQHLHVGIRDADRAIAICTAIRSVLPEILALSANSAVYEGRLTRLHSTRTSLFTRSFPRCGIPDPLRDFAEYEEFVHLLERTGSVVESTQIWWSIRPHHRFGTIEVRIADGQTEMVEALAVAALSLALVAQFAADYDAGVPLPEHAGRFIEENLWRAQKHGLEGRMIDLDRGDDRPTSDAVRALIERTAPVHEQLGLAPFIAQIPVMLKDGNGAQRQIRAFQQGEDPAVTHARAVERTR